MPNLTAPSAIPLPDGRILVLGGALDAYWTEDWADHGDAPLGPTAIWDDASHTWTRLATPKHPCFETKVAALEDGTVFVLGDLEYSDDHFESDPPPPESIWNNSQIYSPSSDTWSIPAQLPRGFAAWKVFARPGGGARVLGSSYPPDEWGTLPPVVIFELHPSASTWGAPSPTPVSAKAGSITQLADGGLLVVGGSGPLADVWVMEPSGDWLEGPPLPQARGAHSATLLADGRVAVVGGDVTGVGLPAYPEMTLADVCAFDPSSRAWQPLAPLSAPRCQHSAIGLADGRVLVVGGKIHIDGPRSEPRHLPEIYDPQQDTWRVIDEPFHRFRNAYAPLSGGGVLAYGGREGSPDAISVRFVDDEEIEVTPQVNRGGELIPMSEEEQSAVADSGGRPTSSRFDPTTGEWRSIPEVPSE